MIYIDNGTTVEEYDTDKATEKAIATLLKQIEGMAYGESVEGCKVKVVYAESEEV